MFRPVILFILCRGADPEVGADVNDFDAGADQRDGVFGGETVRKGKERHIAGLRDFSHIGSRKT